MSSRNRRGASTLGCLFSLLIAVAVMYFGVNVGRVYWRFYQFQDDMRQEVRFATTRTNDQIVTHLRASADSLGLPEAAGKVSIRRTEHTITVESDYYETVEFPMIVREIHFNPRAEGTF
ncbi:MAG TPA: hypothetical protein VIP11_17435 [Gemmatimonadaceae bacterium]